MTAFFRHAGQRQKRLIVCAAMVSAAAQVIGSQAQGCVECYWTRYWSVSPTFHEGTGPVEFPETAQLEKMRPHDLGVAFSGGGTRAAAAAVGQLRALIDNGWLDNVRYIAAVSGGTWSAVPFTFSSQDADSLLNFPRSFEGLTPQAIKKTADRSLAHSIANSRLLIAGAEEALEILLRRRTGNLTVGGLQIDDLVDRIFGRTGGPDTTYSDMLERLFITPHLNERADLLFTWSGDAEQEMFKLNARLAGERFMRPAADRPFLIAGGTMFYMHPAFDYPRLIPVEYTPLYTGVRQQYGPNLGGGYVWPWAYDGESVGESSDGQAMGVPDARYLRVRVDLSRRRFTLSDVVGSSGAAPQLFLFRNARLRRAANLFPIFNHYTLRPAGGGVAASGMPRLLHGDGGFTDNLGLMPLLARQVGNIMVFVNGQNEIDENISLKSLFWPVDELDNAGGDRSMNVVFHADEYETLKAGLFKAAQSGPAVFCMTHREVLPNELYNIRRHAGPRICWVYNRAVPAWSKLLPTPTQDLLQKSSRFDRFPWFRTFGENIPRVTRLTDQQVIMLAQLSYWNITNKTTRDEVRKALAGANLD
jgi:hypothetical protein